MSSSLSPFIIAQQYLTRYGMPTYVTLGNIGLLFNIAIFSQPTHRRIPCSLYILFMSLCSMIGLNVAVIPTIYALNHPNLLLYSLAFCQLQYYFRHAFSQMMRTFFVLACADRYAISSKRPLIRSFSRYIVAIRVIPSVILCWLVFAIFPSMLYSNANGVCDATIGLSSLLYALYILSVLGIFPLASKITFGYLMVTNLKQIRGRVHPIGNKGTTMHVLRKRDRDMIRMLLIELIIYACTTIPGTIVLIYMLTVQRAVNNHEQQHIKLFISYFSREFLLYMNNSLSFWIYLSTSRSFRIELKNLTIKWFNRLTGKRIQLNRRT